MHLEVISILDKVLNLGERARSFTNETQLLGALPELDSLALTGLLQELERHFKIRIEDDEIDRSVFKTVGSLSAFIEMKTQMSISRSRPQ